MLPWLLFCIFCFSLFQLRANWVVIRSVWLFLQHRPGYYSEMSGVRFTWWSHTSRTLAGVSCIYGSRKACQFWPPTNDYFHC